MKQPASLLSLEMLARPTRGFQPSAQSSLGLGT